MSHRTRDAEDGEDKVSKSVDCLVFEDQLDALVRDALPVEGKQQLRLHAADCADCAMQLKVQEHLKGSTLEELESRVPEELVGSVWAGVEAGMTESKAELPALPPRRPTFGWLFPTLAAASILLLFSTGFLLRELNLVQGREAVLAQQVSEQQRWLGELEIRAGVNPVARTAALAGRDVWMRALSRQESITVSGLQDLLRRMPGDRVVLSAAQLERLIRSRTPIAFRFLRVALGRIDGSDGVTARELLEALSTLDVNQDLSVPTAELVALLS